MWLNEAEAIGSTIVWCAPKSGNFAQSKATNEANVLK